MASSTRKSAPRANKFRHFSANNLAVAKAEGRAVPDRADAAVKADDPVAPDKAVPVIVVDLVVVVDFAPPIR